MLSSFDLSRRFVDDTTRRGSSRAQSQQPSTIASQSYEQDQPNASYGGTAFDAYSPYDADYGVAPPRPPPMPYDDPYADECTSTSPTMVTTEDTKHREIPPLGHKSFSFTERGRPRGRSKRDESRGRGHRRGQRGRASGSSHWSRQSPMSKEESVEPYSPHDPRPFTSGPMAHEASGQNTFATPYAYQPPYIQGLGAWPGSPPVPGQAFGFSAQGYQQQSTVQPHINPLFASAFGLNLYSSPYGQFPQQPQFHQHGQTWTDDWRTRMDNSPNQIGDSNNIDSNNIDPSERAE